MEMHHTPEINGKYVVMDSLAEKYPKCSSTLVLFTDVHFESFEHLQLALETCSYSRPLL